MNSRSVTEGGEIGASGRGNVTGTVPVFASEHAPVSIPASSIAVIRNVKVSEVKEDFPR